MAITYMTKEGYDKKMKEIAYLESVERPKISAAIAEARDKGDLSENSEYDAAKEAQGMLEMKMMHSCSSNCRIRLASSSPESSNIRISKSRMSRSLG